MPVTAGKYDEMLDALNPVFISTPGYRLWTLL